MEIDYNINNKVKKLFYNNGEIDIDIETFVYAVTNFRDARNIGTILECYRQKNKLNNDSANQYFNENLPYIDKFFNTLKSPEQSFTPDYVMIFYPRDPNLQNIVKKFVKKLKINLKYDYSSAYYKKNNNKPISDLTEGTENFIYDKPKNVNNIQNLILIDDSIDAGRTIKYFLNKLSEHSLISSKTNVRFFCIYNNPKRSQKMLNEIKNVLNEMSKEEEEEK